MWRHWAWSWEPDTFFHSPWYQKCNVLLFLHEFYSSKSKQAKKICYLSIFSKWVVFSSKSAAVVSRLYITMKACFVVCYGVCGTTSEKVIDGNVGFGEFSLHERSTIHGERKMTDIILSHISPSQVSIRSIWYYILQKLVWGFTLFLPSARYTGIFLYIPHQ